MTHTAGSVSGEPPWVGRPHAAMRRTYCSVPSATAPLRHRWSGTTEREYEQRTQCISSMCAVHSNPPCDVRTRRWSLRATPRSKPPSALSARSASRSAGRSVGNSASYVVQAAAPSCSLRAAFGRAHAARFRDPPICGERCPEDVHGTVSPRRSGHAEARQVLCVQAQRGAR
jgi:hypothetical protein